MPNIRHSNTEHPRTTPPQMAVLILAKVCVWSCLLFRSAKNWQASRKRAVAEISPFTADKSPRPQLLPARGDLFIFFPSDFLIPCLGLTWVESLFSAMPLISVYCQQPYVKVLCSDCEGQSLGAANSDSGKLDNACQRMSFLTNDCLQANRRARDMCEWGYL